MPKPKLSKIVTEQIQKPSPIRQIMKMAERKNIIKVLGGNLILTPDDESIPGAVKKAEELVEEYNAYMPFSLRCYPAFLKRIQLLE